MTGPEGDWLSLTTEYEQWEPEFIGDAVLTATQRKTLVMRTVLQVYLAYWRKRLTGEADIPKPLSSLPPETVLNRIRIHQDLIETNLSSRMILDHLLMELREGFKKGVLADQSFADLAFEI